MALDNAALLSKVKDGLSVGGAFHDSTLQIKVVAVKQFMINAGITLEQLETDLGIATLTIGVMDLWNLTSGEVKFSDAFLQVLMPQMMVVSLPDVQT